MSEQKIDKALLLEKIIKETKINLTPSDREKYPINSLLKEDYTVFLQRSSAVSFRRRISHSINQKKNLIIPDYTNQLDFIDYVEFGQYEIDPSSQHFFLKHFKQTSKIKIDSLGIKPLDKINELIFEKGNVFITAITAKKDLFVIGDNLGKIKIYSLITYQKLRELSDSDIQSVSVNCFDFTQAGDYLFAGYSNGLIAVFDIQNNKCKLVTNKIHISSCIEIKIYKYKQEQKIFHIFSSDSDGNVCKSEIKIGIFNMFKLSETSIFFSQEKNPVFLIKMLRFNEEENKNIEILNGFLGGVVFGTCSYIRVFSLSNFKKPLLTYKKPRWAGDGIVPDIAVGIGKPPSSQHLQSQDIKPQILVVIGWGKVIDLYVVPVFSGDIAEPYQIGYHINSFSLLRIGFLSHSLLYVFDMQRRIKILNTRKFNLGTVELISNSTEPIVPKTNFESELNDAQYIAYDIRYQAFEDKSKAKKATYTNFIIENDEKILLLGHKSLYCGKLLDWSGLLELFEEEGKWNELLVVGIDIFQGKMPALSGVPSEENKRKQLIGEYLKKTISRYINAQIKECEALPDTEEKIEEIFGQYIEIATEFCIGIESVDYLLTNIQPIFEDIQCTELLLSKLEPFILSDQISKIELTEEVINKIISIYQKENKLGVLSQILIHLNIKSVDTQKIKNKCEELSLTNPLIYIYMHGEEENYFKQIPEMFTKFRYKPKDKSIDYKEQYEKSKDLNAITESRQYLGQKILWYIRWCLTGKKFPNRKINMKAEKFKEALASITYWMLSKKTFEEFIELDPENFFMILQQILSEERLNRIIEEEAKSTKQISASVNLGIASTNAASLIDLLITYSKTKDNSIKYYIHEIVLRAYKLVAIKKESLMESIEFILFNYREKYKRNMKEENLFEISDLILKILENNDIYNRNDLSQLYAKLEKDYINPFDLIKLFICQRLNMLIETLEIYLNPDARINFKEKKIFKFLENTLESLEETDKQKLEQFKASLLDKISTLGKISSDKTFSLICKWLPDYKIEIAYKLKVIPEVQLKYIEFFLKEINNKLQEQMIDIEEKTIDELPNLLKTHILLLCQLNLKDQILPNLKKNNLYPPYDCLKLCLNNQVYDASIYLYKVTGALKEALDLGTSVLQIIFDNLCILFNKEFSPESFNALKNKFNEYLDYCIDICKHTENKDQWFNLLGKLYKFSEKMDEKDFKQTHIKEQILLDNFLTENIKDLLEKMCFYVEFKRILNEITRSYKNAEFREFKELLIKMLNRYSHSTKILNSVRELLSNLMMILEDELIIRSLKGNDFKIGKCAQCSKSFRTLKSDDNIFIFRCGHAFHMQCAIEEQNMEEDINCKICNRNEIEMSDSSYSMNRRSTISERLDRSKSIRKGKEHINVEEDEFEKLRAIDAKTAEIKKIVSYLYIIIL